jgi:hypothetical protein
MNNEFKKLTYNDQTVYVLEDASSGGTSAGSIATVSKPVGSVRKRGQNLIAQEGNKDKVDASKPRNFVAKNAKMGGAGAHKDQKKAAKQGDVKHKNKEMDIAEGSEDKIKQLKADHATAVHWSKNETSPQKREAARQKAEKIKAHLEKQYEQGVEEGGIVKSIKRGMQGWGGNDVTPTSIKQRAGEYSDDELKGMSAGHDELRRTRASTPMPTEVPKHSPAEFQKRVVDREMKKRGIGEQGVEEGTKLVADGPVINVHYDGKHIGNIFASNKKDTPHKAYSKHWDMTRLFKSKKAAADWLSQTHQTAIKEGQGVAEGEYNPDTFVGKKGTYKGYGITQEGPSQWGISSSLRKFSTLAAAKRHIDKNMKEGVAEEWSRKYKSSINCSHPKGFSQKAHCAGKKKHTESMMTMEATCPDCGMCQTHGDLNEIKKGAKDSNGFTKCWPGKHAVGTKKGKNGGQVRNCVPNEGVAEQGYGNHPSQRVDPRTGKKYVPPKSPLGQGVAEDHSTATGGWGQGAYASASTSSKWNGAGRDDSVHENPDWYNDEANGMTTSQLKSLIKHAAKLRHAVKAMQAQGDTLEPWQQAKVTKAADYLDAVFTAVDDDYDMGENVQPHEEDQYMAELQAKLNEKIPKNAPVERWIDDFAKAAKTPNAKGHHQFKNKNPEKIRQMAIAASYSAKNPSKKKK